jgi:prolyl-tRNA synthetase
MRLSRFHLATTREAPNDAEIASHKLMLRTGMIRKLGSGIYTWAPLGLRVLRKVEGIVREEMQHAGAIEMTMPCVQPRELWEESGRWGKYGPTLLKMRDRKEQEYCFGPTHEEIICDFVRSEISSYKQLPITFFQIQTKFRDEIRPRFGVMRAREFLMKDAYSFHLDEQSVGETYAKMFEAYSRIFTRLGLKFRPVAADSGAIGGDVSHEFQVLADSGEDAIAFSSESGYAANVELAEAVAPEAVRPEPSQPLKRVDTPTQKTIDDISAFLKVPATQCVKTLLVRGTEGVVALCLRGDHELNEVKASKLPELGGESVLASEEQILAAAGAHAGFIGPAGLPEDVPVIVDRAAAVQVGEGEALGLDQRVHLGANLGGAFLAQITLAGIGLADQFIELIGVERLQINSHGDSSGLGSGKSRPGHANNPGRRPDILAQKIATRKMPAIRNRIRSPE